MSRFSRPSVLRKVMATACLLVAATSLSGCRDDLDEDGHFEDWIEAHPFTDARLVEAKSEHFSFTYEARDLRVVIDVPGLADWGDEDDWARVARARDEVCAYPTQDPETTVLTYLNRFGVHKFHGLDGNGKEDDGLGSLEIGCDTDVPALLRYISTIWRVPHVTAQEELGSYGETDLLSDWFRVDDISHLDTVARRVTVAAAAFDPDGRPGEQFSAGGNFSLVLTDVESLRPSDVDDAVALARQVEALLPPGYVGALAVTLDGEKLPDPWGGKPGEPPWYLSCGVAGRAPCAWSYEIGVMHKESPTSNAHDTDVRDVIGSIAEAVGATTTRHPGKPLITFGTADYHELVPITDLRASIKEHPNAKACCKR